MSEPGGIVGPNGEKLELKVGSKAIGLYVRDLIPILLLVAGVLGGYLIYVNVSNVLERIRDAQIQFQTTQQIALGELKQLQFSGSEAIKLLQRESGEEIKALMRAHDGHVAEQTEIIRRYLITLNWNMAHPSQEHLPLDMQPREKER